MLLSSKKRKEKMVRILVVEDDLELNRFVSLSLRNYGYEVTAVYNGEEGVNVYEQGKFDMI